MINWIRNNINRDSEAYPYWLSIFNGFVKKVNGESPNPAGEVEITTAELEDNEGGGITLTVGDTARTLSTYAELTSTKSDLEGGYNTPQNFIPKEYYSEVDGYTRSTTWTNVSCSKNFIAVTPSERVKLTPLEHFNATNKCLMYDEHKNYIGYTGEFWNEFNLPDNCYFVRFNWAQIPTESRIAKISHYVNGVLTPLWQTDAGSYHKGLSDKQDTLVSGTNIKTINNNSVLGEGNLEI